ncbi:MAG: universal stress protein [Betaproteobacteria bacterium]|jgi:nucleotide-binding universal stress UspA family protein|nr:MAG: universal stress protein [Betaproteobacteria bacterium]
MKKVLVALDGSDHSQRALDEVLKLFETDSMHIHLLSVCEPIHVNEVLFKDTLSDMRQLEDEHMAFGRNIVETGAAKLKGANISHDMHVDIGHPAQVIAEFAKKYHCEMIAMGTRGLGAIRTLAVGSVANKVVHLSEVPVLLVR